MIFIALPMDYDESIAIIEIFVDFLSNYSVALKVHPATIDVIKNRILEYPKYEYTFRTIKSIIKSCEIAKFNFKNVNFKIIITDDKSKKEEIG